MRGISQPLPDRGQTPIDFMTGMGVFLVAMAFLAAFIPAMFAPFQQPGIGDPVVADRSASHLVAERLAVEDQSVGIVSPTKNASFFDNCTGADWLRSELNIDDRDIRVSVGEASCGPVPDQSVTVSRRLVRIDETYHILKVEVW